jgi:hypothetical protein
MTQAGRDNGGPVRHARLLGKVGIATKSSTRRGRDRIDPLLDRDVARARRAGDPVSEHRDEVVDLVGGQRSVDAAVPSASSAS